MTSFFGGNGRSYFRINPVQISSNSSRFPKGKEAGLAQLKKNKEASEAFAAWRKANGYLVSGYQTRTQAEAALKSFRVPPPVEVEITEYANL